MLLVALLVFRALLVCCRAGLRHGRRPARETSAPRASLGASARSPDRPRCRPRALQSGPAAAHGHCSQALRSLRRPPHQWRPVCWRVAWRVGSLSGHTPPPPTGPAVRPAFALHTDGDGGLAALGADCRRVGGVSRF